VREARGNGGRLVRVTEEAVRLVLEGRVRTRVFAADLRPAEDCLAGGGTAADVVPASFRVVLPTPPKSRTSPAATASTIAESRITTLASDTGIKPPDHRSSGMGCVRGALSKP
jgi:hypothetical protein